MKGTDIKKAILITPPAFTFKRFPDINPIPPVGLGYIASVLERRGIEVKIFDSLIEDLKYREDISENIVRIGASFKKIEDLIKEFNPDMVGVSNLFSRQSPNAHEIYKLVKRIREDIIVIAGGAHPTVVPQVVMKDKNVDFVVIGEGEESIIDLIDYIEGRKDAGLLDGIALRKGGKTDVIPKSRFIRDLDNIPFPAHHLMHLEKYFGLEVSHGKRNTERFFPIVTSRGCPAGCTFCTAHQVWGRGFRKRSPGNVIREMKELKDTYQMQELMFEDDNVTLDVQRAEEIFDLMIKENLNFKWDTPNGVAAFALEEKLIKKMQEAGCYKLNIAVESGNKDVLKNIIKKPLDLEKVKNLLKYAKGINLETCIFLIIGLPGETLSQMWDSYRFAKNIGIYNPFVSIATPYPGSELYDICVENGFIKDPMDFSKLYITSCSISTDKWKGEDVRKVFDKGYTYLRLQYYKRHPILLLGKIMQKLFSNPFDFIKKAVLLCQHTKN